MPHAPILYCVFMSTLKLEFGLLFLKESMCAGMHLEQHPVTYHTESCEEEAVHVGLRLASV